MNMLRWGIAGTIAWLLVSYNLAKLYDVSAPHPGIGLGAALATVGCLLLIRRRRVGFPCAVGLPLLVYAGVKEGLVRMYYAQSGALSIGELSVAAVTLGVGALVLEHIETLQTLTGDLFGASLGGRLRPFSVGQEEIYREVRRARVYQRPLSLLTFAYDVERPAWLETFEKRVRRELMDHAAAAHVAALLAHERTDCEVIVQHGDHLITALPAVGREDAVNFARKFVARAEEHVGLRLRFGCATFPEDGVTFESLLQQAEAGIDDDASRVAAQVAMPARERRRHVVGADRHPDAVVDGPPPLSADGAVEVAASSLFSTDGGIRAGNLVRSLRPRLRR